MSEDDFSHQTNISHRQGKMLRADWDYLLDAPDNSCLYCLTDMQVRALLVVAEYLGWPSRYYSEIGTPINRDDVDALRGGVVNALMTDRCSEIITKLDTAIDKLNELHTELTTLQTDLDVSQTAQDVAIAGILAELTTVVEPSIAVLATAIAGIASQTTTILSDVTEIGTDVDNIETVITDPVDGLAEVSEDVDAIELKVNKMQGQVTNITNNTIISINVGVPDQTFTSSSQDTTLTETYARYNALCQAVLDFILIEGWNMIYILDGTVADLSTVQALIAAEIQNLVYAVDQNSTVGYTASTVTGAFTDSTAVNDVACAMISYLANLSPTPYNFGLALSTYTPPALPDNRKIIYDTLQIALGALNGFQVFSAQLGPEYDLALAANPTSFNCPPCGAVSAYCTIPQTWDFTLGQKTPWLFQRGILQPGVGLVGTQIPGDLNFGVDMSIYWSTPCTSIIGHNMECQRAKKSASGGNSWTIEFYYLLAGVETRYNQSNRSQGTAWPIIETDTFAVPTPPGGVGVSRFRIYTNTAYYGNATSQASDAAKITVFKTKT